jgi:hypothetical protein
MAWKYSASDIGSVDDKDFWITIQSSIMGLLSLFTAMYPLYRRSWGTPWRWLQLSVLGATCSVAAIPTYPNFWSSVLSFVCTVSQAFITLQLSLVAMQQTTHRKQD